jgi:hypothetical protein
MTAVVEGLGPWFRLQLTVCNEGANMVQHLRVRLMLLLITRHPHTAATQHVFSVAVQLG